MLKSVAVIVLDGLAVFELGVLAEVFGIDRSRRPGGVPAFDFTVCTPEPGPVRTKAGFSLNVDHGLEAAARADLVVVAPSEGTANRLSESAAAALRDAHERGAWVMSVCSAAFLLAQAGLLDGRRATTHWMYSCELAERYPQCQVDEDVLYVQDGHILTSAGTAAAIDAALHLVRLELGAGVAAAIARDMVVPPHRDGGQVQFIARQVPEAAAETLEVLLEWMGRNLAQEHTVKSLAARANMSERTLARRFKAETGTTPAAWLSRQRVLQAQELLEKTDLGMDEVARAAGFGQAGLLRHHFRRGLGVSPAAYRRTFRGRSPAGSS